MSWNKNLSAWNSAAVFTGVCLLSSSAVAAVISQSYSIPLGVNTQGKVGNNAAYLIGEDRVRYGFTWVPAPYLFDFDGNGTTDLTISGSERGSITDAMYVTQHGRNQVWSLAGGAGGNDFGSHALALIGGTTLGPSLHSEVSVVGWHNDDDTRSFSILMEGYAGTPVSGTFFPSALFEQKYLGFRFEREGALHYGWMALSGYAFYGREIYVYSWAYESEPDTALVVGQIPEPTVTSLMGLCLYFGISRRRVKRMA